MSYVPPHLRNRKEKQQPVKETKIIEAEFPTFVSNHKPVNNFKGPSFLSKIQEDVRKEDTTMTKEITIPTTRSRYTYYERRQNDEYNDESESEPEVVDPQTTVKKEDDGWQTVERKLRIKRDKVQEALDNDDAPIDDDNEESAWDEQPEEYETYWDERRH